MLSRRSLRSEIQPLDPEIKQTIRANRTRIMDHNHEIDTPR